MKICPKPPLFLLFLRDFQPFTPPDAFDPLMVHLPARIVQQASDHAIAVTPILIGQLDDVVGQTLFICPALGCLALRGPVLPERTAGAAL